MISQVSSEVNIFQELCHRITQGEKLCLFKCCKYLLQLDVALEEVETQRNGLVFIYNMTNSKYSNFDYDLSQKMLTLLKGNNKKWIWITLTVPVFRLLSRPVKKGVDSDGTSMVQSSLQSSQTFRSGKAEGPSIHREHTSGKMTHWC